VPIPDSCTAANSTLYSITSSALACSVKGTVSPSALAVLRLMTSSNFVGWRTGRSAGLAPLRTTADVHSGLAIGIRNAGAIAHQAADGGELAPLVDRGNRMARRQRDEFLALAVEEGIAADNERTRPLLNASVGNRSY
jgi:hypothetical protein